MRNFRKLHVWSDSISMVDVIYKTTSNFPDSEKWGLSNQMVRCAVSIPSNIAEGFGRISNKDFSRFVQISLGSAFELETQLIIARNRKFIKETEFEEILIRLQSIQFNKMIFEVLIPEMLEIIGILESAGQPKRSVPTTCPVKFAKRRFHWDQNEVSQRPIAPCIILTPNSFKPSKIQLPTS